MKYKELTLEGTKILKNNNKDECYSSLLMKDYLNYNELDKINNIKINKKNEKKYKKAISQIVKNKPIQYIIGNVNFFGYKYKINKNVLIPRFETEELVNEVKNYILKHFKERCNLIDIGTGSGVIGLTLKKELPYINATLTDISSLALKIARYNAKKLKIKVKFIKGDMLTPLIKKQKKYDIIISNPPYIKSNEELMDIVKENEPKMALYGGNDGLKYYRKILKDAKNILNNKGIIALEIGDPIKEELGKLVAYYFKDSKYIIKKDLQGRYRMLFIFYNIND